MLLTNQEEVLVVGAFSVIVKSSIFAKVCFMLYPADGEDDVAQHGGLAVLGGLLPRPLVLPPPHGQGRHPGQLLVPGLWEADGLH